MSESELEGREDLLHERVGGRKAGHGLRKVAQGEALGVRGWAEREKAG